MGHLIIINRYMRMNCNSGGNLPLRIKIRDDDIIFVRSFFNNVNSDYSQVFLDACLYKLLE